MNMNIKILITLKQKQKNKKLKRIGKEKLLRQLKKFFISFDSKTTKRKRPSNNVSGNSSNNYKLTQKPIKQFSGRENGGKGRKWKKIKFSQNSATKLLKWYFPPKNVQISFITPFDQAFTHPTFCRFILNNIKIWRMKKKKNFVLFISLKFPV